MTRPLRNLSQAIGFLALMLGGFASLLAALSSIAGDPPAGMGLGRGGELPENTPGSAPGPSVDGPVRSRHLRLPHPGFITRVRLIRWIRGSRKRLALVSAVGVALVAGLGVFAYFLAAGAGTGNASTGTLATTTITTHTATGNSVSLAWGPVSPPVGVSVDGYYVLRSGLPAAAACGSAASPITGSSCTDTAPSSSSPVTYSYTVVTKWRSWTSTSNSASVLVKGNQTITFTSTAPAGAVVGGSTYTVTASGGGSGNAVTFTIDATATSVCSISGAVVSFTAVGTCVIDANQTGNSNYNAAPQAQQSFAVAKGSQTITFTSTPPANGKVGTTYSVTATGGGSGNAVTFTIDATTSSICSIVGSTVTFTTLGTCKVDANQAGNSNYHAAPQAQQSVTVNTKGDQTITFGAIADRRLDQSPFTVSATGGGSGNAVTFSSATGTVCTVSGTSATLIKTGTCTINADQSGNANWNAATQVQQSFTVTKGNQTITFGALAGKTFDQGPITVSATASSGLAVAFTSATTGVCTVSGTTVTFVTVGTCTINADQAGDTNWNAASQVQRSFTISKGNQTITFGTIATKTFDQSPLTIGATASSGLAVTFTSATAGVCTVSGTSVTFVTVGTCTINADQAGNTNWNAATQVQQTFTINKGNQTITFGALAGKRFDEGPITVGATSSSGLAVVFTSATAGVCTVSGTTVTFVAVGTCTINANQAGNPNWTAAPQVQQSFAISKGNQTITFGALANKTFDQSPITVGATSSSGLAVAFTSATAGVCTVSGTSVTFVTIGTCTINANQAGNPNWTAAPQVQQSFTITKGNQTITFGALANKTFDQGPITVSATASSGLTVAFTSATTGVCTAGGTNGATITFVTVGLCTINANQAGDSNWTAATQVPQSFTISKGNQTISFTSTAPTGAKTGGATYTPTATATSGLAVTFTIDATASSVCSISGGVVSFAAIGACVIDANQAGNANYNAASQVQQSFQVYSSAVTGIVWTGFAGAGTPTCTGAGTANEVCTLNGVANNGQVSGQIAFANSSGTATIFSTQNQSLTASGTSKTAIPSPITINGGSSTSATVLVAQKNGSGSSTITVTFTVPGGGTWTATLNVN